MKIEQLEELARDVYAELGTGHTEAVYQKAMETALRLAGECYEAQRDIPITYKGHHVGRGIADLVVKGLVIELKSVNKLGEGEMAQIRNYMASLAAPAGAIINFGQPGVSKAGEFSFHYVSQS